MLSSKGIYKGIENLAITLGRPLITPTNLRTGEQTTEDVWCPTTELGTWTMRESGWIVLTGNSEYNVHGVTGYRCKTFEQFVWAANNIRNIKPKDCRAWAERFSLERVGPMFDEYFESVRAVADGRGWYAPRPGRTSLDNTTFNARMGLDDAVIVGEVPPAPPPPPPAIVGMTTTPPPPGTEIVESRRSLTCVWLTGPIHKAVTCFPDPVIRSQPDGASAAEEKSLVSE
jgi:hypothetical protein